MSRRTSPLRAAFVVALSVVLLLTAAGCTRRQVIPGVVAGAGAAMLTSGAIYRATMDTDEPFGDTGGEIAGVTILIFGGIGLLVTGVVLSATFAHCESNDDCWASDVCELRSHTCISREAARALQREVPDEEDEGEPAGDAGPAEGSPPDGASSAEEEERPPYPY